MIKNDNSIKDIIKCPQCKSFHVISCEHHSRIEKCLFRLRNILLWEQFKLTSYPKRFKLSDELKNIERLLEEISGFPGCCIEAYVNGKSGIDMDKRINWNYVLCDKCESEVIKKIESQKVINN